MSLSLSLVSGWIALLSVQVVGCGEPLGWRHEPRLVHWIPVADLDFNGPLPVPGWHVEFNADSLAAEVADSSAPWSPPGVVQFAFPRGRPGGSAPAHVWTPLPAGDAVYVGIWWRTSPDWDGHPSNVNKVQYLHTNSQGSVFMAFYGDPGGPYELRVFPQFSTSTDEWLLPNVENLPLAPGMWHQVEWLVERTDRGLGRIRWWMDGVLLGDHDDLPFPEEPLAEYKLAPVWGGSGGEKHHDDFIWYDHVRITVRSAP